MEQFLPIEIFHDIMLLDVDVYKRMIYTCKAMVAPHGLNMDQLKDHFARPDDTIMRLPNGAPWRHLEVPPTITLNTGSEILYMWLYKGVIYRSAHIYPYSDEIFARVLCLLNTDYDRSLLTMSIIQLSIVTQGSEYIKKYYQCDEDYIIIGKMAL